MLPPGREARPLAVVLSGPSGVGKDAVLQRLRQRGSPAHFTVTCTTRPMRRGEEQGREYVFVSREEFEAMKAREELLEWAEVYGHYYGVPKKPVKQALEQGRDVFIKVDVQGATTIKRLLPQAVFIFVSPPTLEKLALRLKSRRNNTPSDLALRLKIAGEEMARLPLFDYAVVNRQDRLEEAVSQVEAIITAEKCRVKPRVVRL